MRPPGIVYKSAPPQVLQTGHEMTLGMRTVIKFQPVLFGEGEKRGFVVLRLPQDAEKRGKIFFCLLGRGVDASRGVGGVDIPGLGAGAEAKVGKPAARTRRDLPVRDFVEDDAGFRTAADDLAVPGKRHGRIFIERRDAHARGEIERLGASGVKIGENALAFYRATNNSDKSLVGAATFNVSPDGRHVAYATADGKSIKVARGGLNSPNGIGVSPDGKMLHVSMGGNLLGFDITGPGKLATNTYPNNGIQGPLQGIADSLKVMADGRVAVCELARPGGIGIHKGSEAEQVLGFPDRYTCNLAFGGADWQDCWIMLSGTGKIAKVRWPSPGLKPAYTR